MIGMMTKVKLQRINFEDFPSFPVFLKIGVNNITNIRIFIAEILVSVKIITVTNIIIKAKFKLIRLCGEIFLLRRVYVQIARKAMGRKYPIV